MATSSRGEQIVAAMLAALNASPSKPATFTRARVDPFNAAELPAGTIFAVREMVEVHGPSTRLRKRQVRIECMVEGATPADSLLDPLYVYAVNTVLNDAATLALVKGIYESGMEWGSSESYKDAAVALIDFEVHYTTTNDPTVAGLQ